MKRAMKWLTLAFTVLSIAACSAASESDDGTDSDDETQLQSESDALKTCVKCSGKSCKCTGGSFKGQKCTKTRRVNNWVDGMSLGECWAQCRC